MTALDVKVNPDADWAGSEMDIRSTTDCCVFGGRNLISWKNKKQSVVSQSSVESEIKTTTQYTCEVMWLQKLLNELGSHMSLPAKL
ncbi:gag-pol polyprotein [Gossypium australe]|uniref:Gag-pol polyprotein n=1 Tax=Gossypium australe TaxID=47621 RepID=A0A5B6WGP6_9ROSI|nr:gag-pol polyprotein [Gossypium australe]